MAIGTLFIDKISLYSAIVFLVYFLIEKSIMKYIKIIISLYNIHKWQFEELIFSCLLIQLDKYYYIKFFD